MKNLPKKPELVYWNVHDSYYRKYSLISENLLTFILLDGYGKIAISYALIKGE